MMMKTLKSLNPGKSTGPDGWHSYLLLSLADELCIPLRILFNKSLNEEVVLSQWQEARITAIHKKGPKRDVGSYRPVSITSIICKLMESIQSNTILVDFLNGSSFSFAKYQ